MSAMSKILGVGRKLGDRALAWNLVAATPNAVSPTRTHGLVSVARPRSLWTYAALMLSAGGFVATANAQSVCGRIFEDQNYGGGAGRSLVASAGVAIPGTRVELYNATTGFLAASGVNTDVGGNYCFSGLTSGNSYVVRVPNDPAGGTNGSSGLRSQRGGSSGVLFGVQTFKTSVAAGGVSPVTNAVGGANPAGQDVIPLADGHGCTINSTGAFSSCGGNNGQSQSFTLIQNLTTNIAGVDFGFNWDTIVNTNDAGQGSLRQFITNSNGLTGEASLTQAGNSWNLNANAAVALPAASESSIFMIPTNTLKTITLTSAELPYITGFDTRLDAGTQTANIGNANNVTLGTGGTVGVSGVALPTLNGPEVELTSNGFSRGLVAAGDRVVIRGFAVRNFTGLTSDYKDVCAICVMNLDFPGGTVLSQVNGVIIEQNVVGPGATSIALAPGGFVSQGGGIRVSFARNGTIIRNNLVGFNGGVGIDIGGGADLQLQAPDVECQNNACGSDGVLVTGNEVFNNGLANNVLDGIDINKGAVRINVTGNLVRDNQASGIDSFLTQGQNSITDNSVLRNGSGLAETSGVRIFGSGSTVSRNIITGSIGNGITVASRVGFDSNPDNANNANSTGNAISQNSIFANGLLGIDLIVNGAVTGIGAEQTGQGITPNDGDVYAAGNGNNHMDYPVITSATLVGTNLTINGYVGRASAGGASAANFGGVTVEIFIADNSPASQNGPIHNGDGLNVPHGEGRTHLGNCTANGSGNLVNCVITGVVGLSATSTLTATATGVATTGVGGLANRSTSEFGPNAPVVVAPVLTKVFNPQAIIAGGVSTLTFTITDSNPPHPAWAGLGFVDNLPANILVANPANVITNCATPGVIAATPGAGSITASGVGLSAGTASCTISVNVTSAVVQTTTEQTNCTALTGSEPASWTNTLDSTANPGLFTGLTSNTKACLTVLPPPVLTKSFSPTTISDGGVTTLTFTLTGATGNPATTVNFTDTLPANLRVAPLPTIGGTCTNAAAATAAVAGGSSIVVTAVNVQAGASSCTVTVNVTNVPGVLNPSANCVGNPAGAFTNGSGNITGLTGATNGVVNSCVTVDKPVLTKSFSPTTFTDGGVTTLTFTLTSAAGNPATTVNFTDTLPTSLRVAAAPVIGGTCGNAVAATNAVGGSSSIVVTAVNVLAGASSCTVTVNVTNVAGALNPIANCVGNPAGAFTNGSGNITGLTGATNGVVNSCVAVVSTVLIKSFSPTAILDGGITTLTFTVTNGAGNPATTVNFTDTLPTSLRVAAAPVIGGTCGNAVAATNAVGGSSSIVVTAVNVLAGASSCTVTVNVTNVAGALNPSPNCAANPAAFTNGSGNITGLTGAANGVTNSCVTVGGPVHVPTLSAWLLALLAAMMLLAGVALQRGRGH